MPERKHVYVEAESKTQKSRRSVMIAPFALETLKSIESANRKPRGALLKPARLLSHLWHARAFSKVVLELRLLSN